MRNLQIGTKGSEYKTTKQDRVVEEGIKRTARNKSYFVLCSHMNSGGQGLPCLKGLQRKIKMPMKNILYTK